jgi:alanyl-tRNA synthetase
MLTSSEIRNKFLNFFASKGHQIVPSAPIVVKNDPTLMFTNAGMNQFKDYFLGNKKAPSSRIADTQKVLRVSGKHNDLEEVGVDTYHHTMFEMLGNWSFGNPQQATAGYFKKEAIEWSWELLTKVLQIPVDRLYVSVFQGDAKEGLPLDEEAAEEWKKWIAEDRILPGNKKDNFWEMGDTGPCGPCTEIHVDMRPDEERNTVDGKSLVNADHPQVIEIWNNVFIQYNRLKDRSLQQLPAKHVDTGMGFERLVRVLQQKSSNYDTDIFTGTIEKIASLANVPYKGSDNKSDIAFRVLADHIRAISFTIADGQLPSNTGAGYVIRRILRRAVRYYYSYLNYQQPLLFELVPVISKQFEDVFPELHKQEQFVTKVIKEEEEGFLRTLEKGLKRFSDLQYYIINKSVEDFPGLNKNKKFVSQKEIMESLSNSVNSNLSKTIVPGELAFELFDTFGFPIDLTQLLAKEMEWDVDIEGFNVEMQKQKNRSRSASATDTEDWIIVNESNNNSLFVGYDLLETPANILRYRKVKAKGKEAYQLILDKTPFYAESGGQVGDTGQLIINNEQLIIFDTKKENNLIIHFVERIPDDIIGEVVAKVNAIKRKKTALHHSATHLLHAALRKVLGTHVAQKGSLVNADYLRFDFSHFSKMTIEEILEVQKIVNQKIRENIPVVIKEMSKDEAVAMGAMALFGEKYGDKVRVVSIDPNYSIELCGGTHIEATGELGFFKITSEGAIAAGVRRIEAICGIAAEDYINNQFQQISEVKEALKNPKDLIRSIQSLTEENTSLRKTIEKFEQVQLKVLRDALLKKTQQINGVNFIGEQVEVNSADALKKLVLDTQTNSSNAVIVLTSSIEGKAYVAISITDELAKEKNLDAVQIIKQKIAPLIKGGGGGQKTLATAGGQDIAALHQVIETTKGLL